MGLDMYAWVVPHPVPATMGSEVQLLDKLGGRIFCHWRKYWAFQCWMEELYLAKGGTADFNVAGVRLDQADLDRLETDLGAGIIGPDPWVDRNPNSFDFIAEAREHIRSGNAVIYDCWY